MTTRTIAVLKAIFIERDPQDFTDDLLDTLVNPQDAVEFDAGVTFDGTATFDGEAVFDGIATFNGTATFTSGVEFGGTATHIWVSPKGNDNKGDGTLVRPYLSITAAFGEVTSSRKDVMVLPGTYQENLIWPVWGGVKLVCIGKQGAVTLSDASAGGTAVLKIQAGTDYATFSAQIEGLEIDHAGTGLMLDNSSATGTWTFNGHDMSFICTGGTSIVLTKGTARPILVTFDGDYSDIGGPIYAEIDHAEDRLRFAGMRLSGGITTSTSPIMGGTAEITLAGCELLHEGVAGGSANQMFNSFYSWARTGKTLTAVDTDDLAGTHTENIV